MTDNTSSPTFYDILGVEPHAPAEKIKAIYRLRSRAAYPVRPGVGNEELQKQLNAAYDTLKNSEKRKEYNELMGLPQRSRPLKPGKPMYAEILVSNNANPNIPVPYTFTRWEPCHRCWGEGCTRCQSKGKILETVNLTVNVSSSVSQVLIEGQGVMIEPGGSRGDLILYVVRV